MASKMVTAGRKVSDQANAMLKAWHAARAEAASKDTEAADTLAAPDDDDDDSGYVEFANEERQKVRDLLPQANDEKVEAEVLRRWKHLTSDASDDDGAVEAAASVGEIHMMDVKLPEDFVKAQGLELCGQLADKYLYKKAAAASAVAPKLAKSPSKASSSKASPSKPSPSKPSLIKGKSVDDKGKGKAAMSHRPALGGKAKLPAVPAKRPMPLITKKAPKKMEYGSPQYLAGRLFEKMKNKTVKKDEPLLDALCNVFEIDGVDKMSLKQKCFDVSCVMLSMTDDEDEEDEEDEEVDEVDEDEDA